MFFVVVVVGESSIEFIRYELDLFLGLIHVSKSIDLNCFPIVVGIVKNIEKNKIK